MTVADGPGAASRFGIRHVTLAAGIGLMLFWLVKSWLDLSVHDMDAYWNAALRLREGGSLYVPVDDPHAFDVYRYAPWFAVAWIPLTYLPKVGVQVAWFAILLAASLAVIVASWRRSPALALALGGALIWTSAIGNVHPLLIASLYFGVERRSGPVWIALAGSLKATPILLALVYVGRGEWKRAGLAFGLFALLVAPMALLPNYPNAPGLTFSLWGWQPELYVVLALLAVGATLYFARTRWAWLAASFAVVASLPRLLLYDFSFMLLGANRPQPQRVAGIAGEAAVAPVGGEVG